MSTENTARESLQGVQLPMANEDAVRAALEQAFDYRGDITITRRDGAKAEGYLFDRHAVANFADCYIRLIPADRNAKLTIPYSDIAALEFTGRDMAAGKSWEAWMKKYAEKKAAGEQHIGLKPERLD